MISEKIDKKKAKLFNRREISLKRLNLLNIRLINFEFMSSLFFIMTERSGFGGLRRLDPWRTENFFDFALLIRVIEKLFDCEIHISWCFGYPWAIHAFGWIENSLWVYLSFDFALHINLLCQKRLFRRQTVSNFWLYLEILLFVRLWGLLWLFKDISDDVFHIDFFVWDSVIYLLHWYQTNLFDQN